MPIGSFVRGPDGKLYVNPLKKAVRDFFLQLDAETINVGANATVGGGATVTQDTHFEGFKWMGRTTDVGDPNVSPRMLVTARNPQVGYNLMNRPCHWATVIGGNLQPYSFPTTLFLPGSQSIQYTFQDFSGAPVTVQLAMEGRAFYWQKFEQGVARKEVDQLLHGLNRRRWFPYWLTTDRDVNLNQILTEQTFTMSIPRGGDFEAWKIAAISDAAFQWTIVDQFSGQFWHNRTVAPNGVDNRVSLGSNLFAMELNEPTLVGAGTQISISIRALALVGGQNRIWFTIGGRLITEG